MIRSVYKKRKDEMIGKICRLEHFDPYEKSEELQGIEVKEVLLEFLLIHSFSQV